MERATLTDLWKSEEDLWVVQQVVERYCLCIAFVLPFYKLNLKSEINWHIEGVSLLSQGTSTATPGISQTGQFRVGSVGRQKDSSSLEHSQVIVIVIVIIIVIVIVIVICYCCFCE